MIKVPVGFKAEPGYITMAAALVGAFVFWLSYAMSNGDSVIGLPLEFNLGFIPSMIGLVVGGIIGYPIDLAWSYIDYKRWKKRMADRE